MKSQGRVLGDGNLARNQAARIQRQQTVDEPIDDKPKSVYEMITRQMLEDLRDDIAEIKGRVNAVIWLMVGAILVELLVKLAN